MEEYIKKYFENGKYKSITEIFPCCNLEQGGKFTSLIKVSDVYNCKTSKFICKSLKTENVDDEFFSLHFFYENGLAICSNSLNTSHKGKYEIKENILKSYLYGYSYPLGKIIEKKSVYKKSDNKYYAKFYYKKDQEWIKYAKTLIKICDN